VKRKVKVPAHKKEVCSDMVLWVPRVEISTGHFKRLVSVWQLEHVCCSRHPPLLQPDVIRARTRCVNAFHTRHLSRACARKHAR